MSTSWASDDRSRRRAYRRPRRSAVPVEIDTLKMPPRSPVSHVSKATSTFCAEKASPKDDTSVWEQTTRRVEILPGSLLMPEGEPWLHPPEPREPPPLPTEIIQFLVLGEQNAGKTTLSRRFQRMHCTHTAHPKSIRKKKENASEWSVEYRKKDVSFWKCDSDAIGCARIQLWDVTGGGPSDKPLERHQEWIRLVQKMSGILLVVSLEHGLNALFDKIASWKQWLDECCPSHPQVHLLLQKSDLLPHQTTNPRVWIDLGSRISKLCDESGISDWQMTTCFTEAAEHSPEQAILELVQSLVTTTAVPQRKVSFKATSPSNVSRVGKSEMKVRTKPAS